MFKKNILWVIALIILVIPSFFSILRPGFFPMQDDMQVFRLYEMDKCVKDFQIPCRWIPDGGYQYGYPQFNFYSPSIYYLGELFHLMGFQFIDSIKILIILGFIFSAITMFILTKEFFGNFPALIASLFYTYAPYHAQQVYVRGSLSEFWASVFFPLILWSLYKLINDKRRKNVVWTALSISGLFLTHNILSFLFVPIIIFWTIFWLWQSHNLKQSMKHIAYSIILGLTLSAFFVLPMLFERGFVHVETLLGGYFDYRQHFVTLKELFLSNNWGYGSSMLGPIDDLSLSAGIVHWVIGVLAVILALFKFKKDRTSSLLILGFGVIEIAVLFLMHEKSSFVWTIFPFLSWLQFPWRFLSLSTFILSYLSSYVVYSLGKPKYILGVILIGLLFFLHLNFFVPKSWQNVNDSYELTGAMWEKELTASIFDYLPIYAKLPPDSKAPDFPEVLNGNAIFVNYKKGTYYQIGKIKVYEDAVIRAPLYDFPGMRVLVDNKVVSHVNNNCQNEKFCLGLITFNVPKGEHDVSVILKNTPIRILGNTLTIVSLGFIVYIIFKKK